LATNHCLDGAAGVVRRDARASCLIALQSVAQPGI
jgi:hypothetical protein